MEKELLNLQNELNKFWEIAGMTSEEYAKNRGNGEWEVDILCELDIEKQFEDCLGFINKENISEEILKLIIECISIDNESERCVQVLGDKLNDDVLEKVLEASLKYSQTEAKWQFTSLIGKKKNKRFSRILDLYLKDNEEYVRRRSLLAYAEVDIDKAIQIAQEKIFDESDYIRLVAVDILLENTNNKEEIIKMFENDAFEYIKIRIEDAKKRYI